MSNVNLRTLVKKAGEMALGNSWGEDAYTINMGILAIDQNNSGSCTRLAKYYMLNDNLPEAKNMYLRALKIDPESRIALNNLQVIEQAQKENAIAEKTIKLVDGVHAADKSPKKKGARMKKAE
ncbi:hypothetical protein LPY66_17260 [Dehalobacter sp. DCM]|uniref:hypothetical protein n=1 Tax=Dehalobacter sp. DCM TaxID=2907827 RepID=UPI00308218EA|nr:hypothetical protein LPY66_17260 [Dehalobacter sp. DCM]